MQGIPSKKKGILKRGKRSQCRCLQCGDIFYGRGQQCLSCDDVAVAKYSNFEVLQQDDLDCQVLSYKTFARRGQRRQLDFIGVLQLDVQRSQVECGEQLIFTHRATLGDGDDADES